MKKIPRIIFYCFSALLFFQALPLEAKTRAKPKLLLADQILIEKAKRQLTLYRKGEVLKTYQVSLGRTPVGAKIQQGDSKTPEGKYIVDWRNPKSQFHLSLHISYPNAEDKRRAAELGVSPGGMIMIHGLPNGFSAAGPLNTLIDWTDGCIAVTNQEIEEIWKLVPDGTEVEIKA